MGCLRDWCEVRRWPGECECPVSFSCSAREVSEVSGSRGAELPARTETLVTHTLGRSFFDVYRVYRFTAMFPHTPRATMANTPSRPSEWFPWRASSPHGDTRHTLLEGLSSTCTVSRRCSLTHHWLIPRRSRRASFRTITSLPDKHG